MSLKSLFALQNSLGAFRQDFFRGVLGVLFLITDGARSRKEHDSGRRHSINMMLQDVTLLSMLCLEIKREQKVHEIVS